MTPLRPGFEPTETDVICARGRTAYNHVGNQTFRGILEQNLEKYRQATTKQQKTIVVNALLEEIKEQSRFVRKLADGKWVEVQEHVAKEKIGQGFRDLLHTEYRSSTKSKVKLRRERRKRQKTQAEQQTTMEPVAPDYAGRRHRPINSTDTFEPLPLEETTAAAPETLIYDCSPFAFAGRDESKGADASGDSSVHARRELMEAASEEAAPVESAPEGSETAPHQEAAPSGNLPTFVTPASPASSRQSRSHHHGTDHCFPPENPHAAWERYQDQIYSYRPPPRQPQHSPPQSHYPRQYYSPPYSPPRPGDYRSQAPPPPPPPPAPQYYPPPPLPHHHHHHMQHHHPYPPASPQGSHGSPPQGPHGASSGWSPLPYASYSYGRPGPQAHEAGHYNYYGSPHSPWFHGPGHFDPHPAQGNYYDSSASANAPARVEDRREGSDHEHQRHPPENWSHAPRQEDYRRVGGDHEQHLPDNSSYEPHA